LVGFNRRYLVDVLSPGDIPPITRPVMGSLGAAAEWLGPDAPVVIVRDGKSARAYPLSILEQHEVVDDTVAGVPIAITYSPVANAAMVFDRRVRSLTLIEPVLPTLLGESDADRRLHTRFAQVARDVSEDLWNGSALDAIDKFIAFWNGSGPQDPLPASARLRMVERVHKLAFDFTAAFAEENVAIAAASLRVPTLLFSGGLSPYLTQRIVQRLGAIIDGAEVRHLPAAGHMLPLTHASSVNPAIARHIARADELAGVPLALEAARAGAVSRAEG